FIDIELLRIDANAQQQFVISADRDYRIAPLIWLPVLENVFKHTRLNKELEIDYRFTIQNGVLKVYCRNNKESEEKANPKSEGGIGLDNLRKRMNLLYPEAYSLEIKEEALYFTVEVEIKLE